MSSPEQPQSEAFCSGMLAAQSSWHKFKSIYTVNRWQTLQVPFKETREQNKQTDIIGLYWKLNANLIGAQVVRSWSKVDFSMKAVRSRKHHMAEAYVLFSSWRLINVLKVSIQFWVLLWMTNSWAICQYMGISFFLKDEANDMKEIDCMV